MIPKREIGVSILLTIITCGIYGIFWFISLTDDTKRASGDETLPSGGVAFLLTIVTCGIYGLYWAYKMGKSIQTAQMKAGFTAVTDNSVLFLILQFFGLGIVNYAIMQNSLNNIAVNGGANGMNMNGGMNNGMGNMNNGMNNNMQQPSQPMDNNQNNNGTPIAQ